MDSHFVIRKPILSEKAYKPMEKGLYTFLVDRRARKEDIKKAVEAQFSVEVRKVNISKIQPKLKRIARTRKTTKVGGGKKAIVWLKKGHSIASLMPKAEKPKTTKKEKDVQAVKAEGKEG